MWGEELKQPKRGKKEGEAEGMHTHTDIGLREAVTIGLGEAVTSFFGLVRGTELPPCWDVEEGARTR